jgi:hypothetical protein
MAKLLASSVSGRFNESGPVEEWRQALTVFFSTRFEGKQELVMAITYSSFCRRAIMISEVPQFASPMGRWYHISLPVMVFVELRMRG